MADKIVVHMDTLHPLVLRIDEMVADVFGIKTAKQVGEIALHRGRNEVDADLWRRWLDGNKENPLMKGRLIIDPRPELMRPKARPRPGPGLVGDWLTVG